MNMNDRIYQIAASPLGVYLREQASSPEAWAEMVRDHVAALRPRAKKSAPVAACTVEMVTIPAGGFLMGSPEGDSEAYSDERPQRAAHVTAFQIGRYPVTQAQWRAVMGGNPSRFKGDALPVESVSWLDAVTFCNVLSEREGLAQAYDADGNRTGGDGYRLPTEAEWEYACRAGTTGSRYGKLHDVAWHAWDSDGKTHPVGEKLPNGFGVYDMLGNVYEWCENVCGETLAAPGVGSDRVCRGGAWSSDARDARAAIRLARDPGDRDDDVGFRLARGQ